MSTDEEYSPIDNSPTPSIHDAVGALVQKTVDILENSEANSSKQLDTGIPEVTFAQVDTQLTSHILSHSQALQSYPTDSQYIPLIPVESPPALYSTSVEMSNHNTPKTRWSLAGSPVGANQMSDVLSLRGKLESLENKLHCLTVRNKEMTANYKAVVSELESGRELEAQAKDNSLRLQTLCDSTNQEKQLFQQQVLQMKMRLDYKSGEVNDLKREMEQLRSQRGAPFDTNAWAEDLLKQWEQVHKDNEILRQDNDHLREQAHVSEERLRGMRHNMELMLEEQRVEQEKHRSEMMNAYEQLHKLAQDRDSLRARLDLAIQHRDDAQIDCSKVQIAKQRSEKDASIFEAKYLAMQEEYIQVMSERDSVLKENQEVSEEKETLQTRLTAMQIDNKSLVHKINIQQKQTNNADSQSMLSSEEEVSNITRAAIDKENSELHSSLHSQKQQLKSIRNEIDEARSNRDWALEERKRVVSERESMRAMCDQLRRERDEAITKLADAIKDTDDLHRQREKAEMQLKMCKQQMNTDNKHNATPSNTPDSAIDIDMAEWDIETIQFNLPDSKQEQLGVELRGGLDDPVMGSHVPVYVKNIEKGSRLDGKLRIYDCITQLNDIDVANMEYKAVMDILGKCNTVKMVVRRRRLVHMKIITVPIDPLQTNKDCGLTFEDGIHISKINTGSAAAKAGNLAVGDRLVFINDTPVDGKCGEEVNELVNKLHSCGGVVLGVLKSPPLLSPITPSTSVTTSLDSGAVLSRKHEPHSPLTSLHDEISKHKSPKSSSKLIDRLHDKVFRKEKKSTVKASACIEQSTDTLRHSRRGSGQSLRPPSIYSTLQANRRNSAFTTLNPANNNIGVGNGRDENSVLSQLDRVLTEADAKPTNLNSVKCESEKNCGGTWPKYRQNGVNECVSVASTLSQRPTKRPSNRQSVFPVFQPPPNHTDNNNHDNNTTNNNNNNNNGETVVVQRRTPNRSAYGSPRPLTYHPSNVPPLSARAIRPTTSISPPPYSDRTGSRHSSSDHSRVCVSGRGDYSYVHHTGVPAQILTHRNGMQMTVNRRQTYVPPPPYPGSTYCRRTNTNYDDMFDRDLDLHSVTSHSSGSVAHSTSSSLHATPRNNNNTRRRHQIYSNYAVPSPIMQLEGCVSPFRPVPEQFSNERVSVGDVRKICIEKGSSCEFLGICVLEGIGQGIFVSEVSKNSLASKNGVLVGDQILDVCGINMRNADMYKAKKVLRELGRSEQITLTVQFNPIGGESRGGVSTSLDWHSQSSTPTRARESSNHSNATHSREMLASISEHSCNGISEPRPAMIHKESESEWGFTLIGGNATGIFVDIILETSPAVGPEGLRVGDRILEFNGINFRKLTLEQAMYELQRTAEDVFVLAQHNWKKFQECKRGGSGDSFYIRVNVDRPTDNQDELTLKQGDIVYVDNTVFMGEPGRWRAWRLDQEARERSCGVIPSKEKLEEEFAMKRSQSEISSADAISEGGTSRRGTIRRSLKFMRRSSRSSQHHSTNSKEPVDSDTIPFLDDLYERVERLDYKRKRPVVLIGAQSHLLVQRLVEDYPRMFAHCVPECVKAPWSELEQGLHSGLYVEFSKRDQLFQVTTVAAVKEITDKGYHCLLDASPPSFERLHRLQIYPIVMFIKYKHTKHVKEVSDFLAEKVSSKVAKEKIDRANEIETHLTNINFQCSIVTVSPQPQTEQTVRHLCQQILSAIEHEQKKTLWILSNESM